MTIQKFIENEGKNIVGALLEYYMDNLKVYKSSELYNEDYFATLDQIRGFLIALGTLEYIDFTTFVELRYDLVNYWFCLIKK